MMPVNDFHHGVLAQAQIVHDLAIRAAFFP
jgi:hypothetical protein